MVKRISPLRGQIVIENHCNYGKIGEKNKVDIRHLGKILEFLVTDKYEQNELEAIFYLIKLFLKSKKCIYTSYKKLYDDIIEESKKTSNNKKRFKFLKSGKNKLIELLKKLTKEQVILEIKFKSKNIKKNIKLRNELGLKRRGPAKYFNFNFSKIEFDLNLPIHEIYFLLDYLVLKHHDFDSAMNRVYKIQDYLKNSKGEIK